MSSQFLPRNHTVEKQRNPLIGKYDVRKGAAATGEERERIRKKRTEEMVNCERKMDE
jgi:hypothetical protein